MDHTEPPGAGRSSAVATFFVRVAAVPLAELAAAYAAFNAHVRRVVPPCRLLEVDALAVLRSEGGMDALVSRLDAFLRRSRAAVTAGLPTRP